MTTQSHDNLVLEATYLRDHLLHVEKQDGTVLGAALQPFERDHDHRPTEAELAELAKAFQDAYDKALGSVDGYTLNEVLRGRSPHKASLFGSVTLTLIGVALVLMAFHFSYWSNRTSFVLEEAERFGQFDHFQSIMKLVELENYFDQVDAESGGDLEPQLVYLEGISALRSHYTDEYNLPREMRDRIIDVSPLRGVWDTTRRRLCPTVAPLKDPGARGFLAAVLSCPRALDLQLAPLAAAGMANNEAAKAPPSLFRTKLGAIEKRQSETMQAAGRQRLDAYALSQYEIRALAQRLRDLLSIVHGWALPIIYGSLGSIVYCMWRVLNPNVAAVGLIYAVMRTAFAGLAALTLSMLLVPSNVLSAGVELNRPVIYLLSFVFGYSIEAFVSTLNTLNTYLSSNLTPKPKRTRSG